MRNPKKFLEKLNEPSGQSGLDDKMRRIMLRMCLFGAAFSYLSVVIDQSYRSILAFDIQAGGLAAAAPYMFFLAAARIARPERLWIAVLLLAVSGLFLSATTLTGLVMLFDSSPIAGYPAYFVGLAALPVSIGSVALALLLRIINSIRRWLVRRRRAAGGND